MPRHGLSRVQLDDFIGLLEAVNPNASGYQARCPAHTDHTPSLSVSEGEDGRILVKDHAGCTTEQIVEAMNLTTTDLFPSDGALPQSAVRFVNTSAPSAPDDQPTIPWATVAALHTQLTDEQRRLLRSRRHLTDAIIDRYQLGFEERASERRLTIPIQDANGSCRDIRRWLPPGARQDGSQKMLHWRTGHGASRLFPADQINNDIKEAMKAKEKERVESEGIQIVWNADRREEGIRAQGIHLHPKELGAILSIDSMEPPSSWLWASTKWEEKIHTEVSIGLNGVCLQSKDPEDMMRKWEKALGVEGIYKNNQFHSKKNTGYILSNAADSKNRVRVSGEPGKATKTQLLYTGELCFASILATESKQNIYRSWVFVDFPGSV